MPSAPGRRLRLLARAAAVALGALLMAGCSASVAQPTTPPVPSSLEVSATPLVSVAFAGAAPTPSASPAPLGLPAEVLAGQHVSATGSFTETETEAAGPMLCHVERDSCAFGKLVSDYDPNVLFSQGEAPPFSDEDRLMNADLVAPLAELARLVAAEWGPDAQVMVTDAYDSLLEHDLAQPNRALRYSLHFEGRSLDVIPWPPDTARIGRLCGLALQAGFDWVYNELDHCHISLAAPSVCAICSGTAGQ